MDGQLPHRLGWAGAQPAERADDLHMLSSSERVMLEDAALGLTVSETARKRSKGDETVKTQRRSILMKLGARNMAQAVAITLREGQGELGRAA